MAHPQRYKNAGGFVQGQLGVWDALFVTYGVRAEWNPAFGENARVMPDRVGVAYTHEFGAMTVKVRGAYGSSTRPPAIGLRDSIVVYPQAGDLYILPVYNYQLPNLELQPEDQRGGEGGVELYFGNRGSLTVTHYNQTVNNMVRTIQHIDSVATLNTAQEVYARFGLNCADYLTDCGVQYAEQIKNMNVGSLRNQGWELTGTFSVGPFATRGTYSWTTSRMIGVTEKFRKLFPNDPDYQVGHSFPLPEHTWAFGMSYANAATTIGLNFNGVAQTTQNANGLYQDALGLLVTSRVRNRIAVSPLMSLPSTYVLTAPAYFITDLNGSHRLSSRVDATFQVHNLNNHYQNDRSASLPVAGRQSNVGVRLRLF